MTPPSIVGAGPSTVRVSSSALLEAFSSAVEPLLLVDDRLFTSIEYRFVNLISPPTGFKYKIKQLPPVT